MNELGQDDGHILAHLVPDLHRNFAQCPDGVVAHGHVVRVQVLGEDGDELVHIWLQMCVAGFGQVAEQRKRTLSHLVGWVLKLALPNLPNEDHASYMVCYQ